MTQKDRSVDIPTWSSQLAGWLRSHLVRAEDTDFILSCVDGDVRCHRLLLMAQGGKLEERVRERLSDGVSRLNVAHLEIPTRTMRCILAALYGGLEGAGMSAENLVHFIHFAHHYGVTWLSRAVEKGVGLVLTPATVLQLYSRPEVSTSARMVDQFRDYCQANCEQILDAADFSVLSKLGILLFLRSTHNDCPNPHRVFTAASLWLSSHLSEVPSCVEVVLELPIGRLSRDVLTSEVYDVIFNKLLIECSDRLSKADKVRLASFYQDALTRVETVPRTQSPTDHDRPVQGAHLVTAGDSQDENDHVEPPPEWRNIETPEDSEGNHGYDLPPQEVEEVAERSPPPPHQYEPVQAKREPKRPISFEVTLETPTPTSPAVDRNPDPVQRRLPPSSYRTHIISDQGAESPPPSVAPPPHNVKQCATPPTKPQSAEPSRPLPPPPPPLAPSPTDPQPSEGTILPLARSREWSNFEVGELRELLKKVEDDVLLVIEGVLLWIAAGYERKQYCEELLRMCRTERLCPNFLRYVINPFLTERILGSSRIVCKLFPPLPATKSRLVARTKHIPVSPTLNLNPGTQSLPVHCECGGGTGRVYLVLRSTLPAMTVEGGVKCEGGCGKVHRVAHIACSSSLTPDIFTSLTLLPYRHLVRELSNMDNVRFFLFQ